MYLNLSLAIKLARASAINTAIGVNGVLQLYSPSVIGPTLPPTPDYPPARDCVLLAQLGLSPVAAVVVTSIQSIAVKTPGSGGTDGAQLITGTTGTGTHFQASATILNGALISIGMIVVAGAYSIIPFDIANEPVTTADGLLIGATVSVQPTATMVFNTVNQSNGLITGTIGFARIATAALAGVLDLDVGVTGSGAALTMSGNAIFAGVPIIMVADILIES